MPPAQTTIHILGAGNIGSLVAYALRSLQAPPDVALILRSANAVRDFASGGSQITLREQNALSRQSGFTAISPDHPNFSATKINNLIITTKTHQTVPALGPLVPSLSKDSTILFIQNGMGVTESVSKHLFPDKNAQPHFLQGISTHGVHSSERFQITLAGHGQILIGGEETSMRSPSAQYLVSTLSSCPLISAAAVSTQHGITVHQLQKLAANAGINPLTAIYNCCNGELLENPYVLGIWRGVSEEVSAVAMKLTGEFPDKEDILSPKSLLERIEQVAKSTAGNTSSMLQDIRNERPTEISYINGFIMRKGKELGIDTPVNGELVRKIQVASIPIRGGYRGPRGEADC